MPDGNPIRERLLGDAFKDLATKDEVGVLIGRLIQFVRETRADLEARITARLALIRDGRDGKDGKDGKSIKGDKGDQGERGPVGFGFNGRDGENGKDGSPDTPEQVRDKLEKLKDDERLDKSAIRGFDEAIASIKEVRVERRGIFGRSLLQLYVGGSKKGAIQYLNLVAGTGVTLTYSAASGRNDVVISASSSGTLSILAATGAVDDSNTTFTFASAPLIVVVNGSSYRDGHGVTISGTTATLDNPPATGGDVYGVG